MRIEGQLRFNNLHALRALAAVSVVFQHLSPILSDLRLPTPIGGVNIFFVLSAFIMGSCCRHDTAGGFMLRRAVRIIPLYWVMTLVTVVAIAVIPAPANTPDLSFGDVVRSLFFVPFDKHGSPLPVLPVGWTLNCEMAFYALFAASLGLSKRPVLSTLTFLSACGAVIAALRISGVPVVFYASGAILCFALGLAVSLAPKVPIPKWAIHACWPILGVALFAGGIFSAFAAAALVYLLVGMERQGVATLALAQIGDASYSLYLTHIFVTRSALMLYEVSGPAFAWAICASVVAGSICLGLLVHQLIEKPISGKILTLIKPRRHPAHLYVRDARRSDRTNEVRRAA